MPITGNMSQPKPSRPTQLLGIAIEQLKARLPAGWRLELAGNRADRSGGYDALLRVEGPDQTRGLLAVELRTQSTSRMPSNRLNSAPVAGGRKAVPVLVAPFVPSDLQEQLRRARVGYIDATGNIDIRLNRPGLFLSATGAAKNPWPLLRPARTLRAAKAARVVRVLTDLPEPLGVRQIAALADADAGYVSRLLRMLEQDGLVVAEPRGPITRVDRNRLVRRWATDYDLATTNRVLRLFEPRDMSRLALRIRDTARASKFRYAVTGSWAASRFASVGPTRLFACFVDDPELLAERLKMSTQEIANVWLVAPFDPVVYERGAREQGVSLAAPAQILVDLLTSPGRSPAEADAYYEWLRKNEPLWRG